jgi:hypothetical protein
MPKNGRGDRAEGPMLVPVNLILSSLVILGCYLGPMYLVGHWHTKAAVLLAIAGVGGVLLYFTWYRFLPEPGDDAD